VNGCLRNGGRSLIDFHTHSLLSDGLLLPSELVRRANVIGYRAIGITDHVDGSNISSVIPAIKEVSNDLNLYQSTFVVPGVEITHAPVHQIPKLVAEARSMGAVLVIVHGESPVEPVAPGTNRAALEAGVDILAHPGFLSLDDAVLARQNGVYLEITSRAGHSLTNGHVARVASEAGALLVIDTDSHEPRDLISRQRAVEILVGVGLTDDRAQDVLRNNERLLAKLRERLLH
jgi:putative hydrolase